MGEWMHRSETYLLISWLPSIKSIFFLFSNILDLLPSTIFPNYPPGGHIDDENNRKAIEALKSAKEYSIVDEEDVLQKESILSKCKDISLFIIYFNRKKINYIYKFYSFFCADKLIISDPAEFHDRSFMAHLNQLPWTEPLFTRRVEQSMITGKHMTFCRVSNESISVVRANIFLLFIH